jgi:hypothetical protein
MIFIVLVLILIFLVANYYTIDHLCKLLEKKNSKQLPSHNTGGSITREAVKQMEHDHASTYFVKEIIIVGRGLTYVWWSTHGVMDYRLYKIAYHTGDTVYFHGDNKVLYVVDSTGKQWW